MQISDEDQSESVERGFQLGLFLSIAVFQRLEGWTYLFLRHQSSCLGLQMALV